MILSPFGYMHISERLRWSVLVFIAARRCNQFAGFIGQSFVQSRIACRPLVTMCSTPFQKIRSPFFGSFQAQAELDIMEQERSHTRCAFFWIPHFRLDTTSRDVPYSPSFVLDLVNDVDEIRNVIDFVFLPGYNNPTVAVLCQSEQTWAGYVA